MEVLKWLEKYYGYHMYERFERGEWTIDEHTDAIEKYAQFRLKAMEVKCVFDGRSCTNRVRKN